MKTKGGHQNRFLRIITIPFRALGKAKDLYVRSMTSYATKVGYGTNYMGTTSVNYGSTALPKSFSVNVSRSEDNEDLRELIRAASARSMAEKMDINHLIFQHQLQQQQRPQSKPKGMPPRSCSVGMAKIDEEKPYAGVGENLERPSSKKASAMYPRSKTSYVASNKRSLVV